MVEEETKITGAMEPRNTPNGFAMNDKELANARWSSLNQYSATFGERQRKKGWLVAAITWPGN